MIITYYCLILYIRFPTDSNVRGIDRQFMWGPALLISPILEKVSGNALHDTTVASFRNYDGAIISCRSHLHHRKKP